MQQRTGIYQNLGHETHKNDDQMNFTMISKIVILTQNGPVILFWLKIGL